ncbi:MAG: DUF4430 domain-containing protein [Lachnospiraceae bacterium]|nr:DUF4430 domain-containing protein [Lachnospiraceae bacterium]
MKMKRMKKALSCILCMVLIVAMALVTTGCNGSAGNQTTAATTVEATPTEAPASGAVETEAKLATKEVTVLGEGSKAFEFSVVDLEGNETWFEIHTDEEMVGAALLTVELIVGEEGPYGLYVKEVNGISADYDKDKTYWAFYVNDEYGATGVDMTPIEEGNVYSFRVSK